MSTDDFLTLYEAGLKARAEADVQIKLLEMRAKIEFTASAVDSRPAASSEVLEFIRENEGCLLETDLEFLHQVEATPRQVASFWGVSVSKVNRLLKKDIFKHGPKSQPGAAHLISTVSVVKAILDGKAKKET